MRYKMFNLPIYLLLIFVLGWSVRVTADESQENISSQESYKSAMDLLPEIDEKSGMRWMKRFAKEMAVVERPFYGINLVDVRKENYEELYENIKYQTQFAEQMGGKLHVYTVTDYGEVQRITWIIRYETFSGEVENQNFVDTIWPEFGGLAEGYTWWVSSEAMK